MKRDPKKYPRRCKSPRCRGHVASKGCHSPYCAKCKIRHWNERHPLERAFHNLRSHARERGKDFSLTIEQFKEFADKTDYMKRKAEAADKMFASLVALMNNELKIENENKHTKKQENPSWL
jgi:hypothetical protein